MEWREGGHTYHRMVLAVSPMEPQYSAQLCSGGCWRERALTPGTLAPNGLHHYEVMRGSTEQIVQIVRTVSKPRG